MNHVYDGFGSIQNKRRYVCKSEINRQLLNELHIPSFIKVEEVKQAFDKIIKNPEMYIVVMTGSNKNPAKRKHTRYVLKYVLYQAVIKGL